MDHQWVWCALPVLSLLLGHKTHRMPMIERGRARQYDKLNRFVSCSEEVMKQLPMRTNLFPPYSPTNAKGRMESLDLGQSRLLSPRTS